MLVDIWRSGGRYALRYQDILQDEVLKFKIFWKKSSFLIFNIKKVGVLDGMTKINKMFEEIV